MTRVIFFIIILIFIFACTQQEDKKQVAQAPADYPDQESWNATVKITKEGRLSGLVQAGYIRKYSSKQKTYLSDSIQIDFYNQKGQHNSVLYAHGGEVNDKIQDMIAYGNVVVISDSGITLYTDTLKWDNKRQKIISDIPIMITTNEGDTLYGDSFISNPALTNYEIVNPRGMSTKKVSIEE